MEQQPRYISASGSDAEASDAGREEPVPATVFLETSGLCLRDFPHLPSQEGDQRHEVAKLHGSTSSIADLNTIAIHKFSLCSKCIP